MKVIIILVVTLACIYSGVRTRERNGIVVTQMQTSQPESLSYMLTTSKNKLLMIDGGSAEDSSYLEEKLLEKGGEVECWFITIAHPENFGAMKRILENGKVQVNQIYISFNEASWYGQHETERYGEVAEFLDFIYSENIIKRVYNVPFRHQMVVDNLHLTILNVANPELDEEHAGFNQSMALKVSNTYKGMIFMGNIADIAAEKMKDNNLDEIDCDAVQISNNQAQMVSDEIYEKMTPAYIFMPVSKNSDKASSQTYLERLKNLLKVKEAYMNPDEDITVKIW